MNIIELAKEAGITQSRTDLDLECKLTVFAALVRAEALAEPVKQEPAGEMIDKHGYKGAAWYGEPPTIGTQLYAAPVDAKAIRAEALEEAAKVCEEKGPKEGSMKLISDGFAAAIRGLK